MKNITQSIKAGSLGLLLTAIACSHISDIQPLTVDNSADLLSQAPPLPTQGTTSLAVRTDIENILDQITGASTSTIESLNVTFPSGLNYLAIGGSLTAGFRNGGLYREAQLTSYPNMLARQMGLKNFRQPLFDAAQGNGTGYKQLIWVENKPRYVDVSNNLAVVNQSPYTLVPYGKEEVNNLGLPGMGISRAWSTDEWRINPNVSLSSPYEPLYRPHFRRLLPGDNQQWLTAYIPFVKERKADFYTIELGLDDLIWYATKGGYRLTGMLSILGEGESHPYYVLLSHLQKTNTKVVIATVPDVRQFPYFKFYQVSEVRRKLGVERLYAVTDDRYYQKQNNPDYAKFVDVVADDDILLPTQTVIDLVDGKSPQGRTATNPLGSIDVLTQSEQSNLSIVNRLNEIVRYVANEHKTPVFDLNALYKRILSGDYVTDDGVRINPTFPDGNFFSQDGLYPTALGQAVITNEWIKVINQHYRTRIALINTAALEKSIKK